jgi:glycosyltransferase involved in cell wall biosynthesis
MSWAKPVIACDAGGIPGVVADHETGLLFPPGDSLMLIRHLDLLLTDHALRLRLGSAGRARAERLFSREAMVRSSLRLYADLATKRS